MPIIELHTWIAAPVPRVFDLCRSVDVHVATAAATGERPIAGTTTGLLALGDEVTWSARHLGWRWQLTSCITEFARPRHFRDSMVTGVFARFDHDHDFEVENGMTRVRDRFDFTSPCGLLGRVADTLLITRHMRRFLAGRMAALKRLAESDAWTQFLPAAAEPAERL